MRALYDLGFESQAMVNAFMEELQQAGPALEQPTDLDLVSLLVICERLP